MTDHHRKDHESGDPGVCAVCGREWPCSSALLLLYAMLGSRMAAPASPETGTGIHPHDARTREAAEETTPS